MGITTNQHVESNPAVCGGKPVVAGSRVRVWDVYVLHERQGKTPDEIIAAYPHLTLADVHAALAYYWDHQAEIDQQMKAADEFVEGLRQTSQPGPLSRKLASRDNGGDSLPPR